MGVCIYTSRAVPSHPKTSQYITSHSITIHHITKHHIATHHHPRHPLQHATAVMKAWWALSDHLMVKFADGFLDRGEPFGYSDDYLKSVGFQNGPPPIPPTAGATLHD